MVRTSAFRRLVEASRRKTGSNRLILRTKPASNHRSNHRCPIIGARSSMPNPSEKIWRCNEPPAGGTLHRLFHSSERPLIGTPIRWERHCIRWERPIHSRERPIDSRERPIDSRERPILLLKSSSFHSSLPEIMNFKDSTIR